ncbi:MAG: pilus assembly protein TadG-related protein [Stappiaceae bacterium]
MTTIGKLGKFLRRAARDESGSIMITAGFAIVMLIVAGGAAVDFARAITTRAVIANAIDAAALAAAKQLSINALSDSAVRTIVEESFQANVGDKYGDVELRVDDVQINPDLGTVTVEASADIPTFFIKLANINDLKVHNSSEVTYSRYDVELALVVDVTGSMSGDIEDLRDASEGVVNILLPDEDDQAESKVKISVVPYSVGVNMGSYAATVTGGASNRCATERVGPEQYTDASYSEELVGDGSGTMRSQDCSSSVILPLTNDRQDLIDNIRALRTDGYTAGHTGIGWGWYTLSPEWSDLWPGDSQPRPYEDDDILKFAVIMTDGDFNTHYKYEELTKNQCKNKYRSSKEYLCQNGTNWYWTENSQWGYNGESSKRGRNLCSGMKDKDIRVYSVFFGSNNSSNGARVMKNCATDEATTYFQAKDGDDLVRAFALIAKDIQSIYLSK